jgi:hypothetical protein
VKDQSEATVAAMPEPVAVAGQAPMFATVRRRFSFF